jgi:hypothetical protein
MGDTIMESLQNHLLIVFPQLFRDETVVPVNLEAVVADLVHQFGCRKDERYGKDLSGRFSLGVEFPYQLSIVAKFIHGLFLADKQQRGLCDSPAFGKLCPVKECGIVPRLAFFGLVRITLDITFPGLGNGLSVEVFQRCILDNLGSPVKAGIVNLADPVGA